MATKLDEIGPRIYRLSTFAPGVGPKGFTFNQFLLDDDEPLLFHTIARLAELEPKTLATMHGSS